MRDQVRIGFRYLADVGRLVEIAPAYLFFGEPGFRHSSVCVQFVTVCGKHIGCDDSNAGGIEATGNECARRTAATKPRFHRSIKAFLKRHNIFVIALKRYVSDVFGIPKTIF